MAQSRLTDAVEKFKKTLEEKPGTDQPINALAKIENIIVQDFRGVVVSNVSLVLDDLTNDEKEQIDAVLVNEKLGSISDIVNIIQNRADKVFSTENREAVDQYFNRLGVLFHRVDQVILPSNIINKAEDPKKKFETDEKELKENKLELLMSLLYKMGVFPNKDISVVQGMNIPDMHREGSYFYIEIPKLNKTVLIHLGYKQATYIVEGIHPRDSIFDNSKDELHDHLGAEKIIFNEDTVGKWMEEMEEALTTKTKLEEVDIKNFDQRQQYIYDIRQLYPTAKDFLAIGHEDRRKLNIRGRKLASITTIVCDQGHGLNPYSNNEHMVVLASYIYPDDPEIKEQFIKEDKKNEAKEWDKETLLDKLKEMYPTVEEFWNAFDDFAKKRKTINGLGKLAIRSKILGIHSKESFTYQHYAMIAQAIYGEGHEYIDCELWGKKEWIERIKKMFPTPESLMSLKAKVFAKIQVHRFKFHQIGEIITGIQDFTHQLEVLDVAFIAREVYGESHEVIDVHFWNIERWKKEVKKLWPAPKDWMAMTIADKRNVDFFGTKITALGVKFGMSGSLPGTNPENFAELGQRIYGFGHRVIDHVVWKPEKWIEEFRLQKEIPATREEFMELSGKKLRKIMICGRRIKYITKKILGGKKWDPEDTKEHREQLADAIYS